MPRKAAPLPAADQELLRRWIAEGADWPADARHWAYVPPVRPSVPGPRAEPPTSPIDAFVNARLTQAGLAPAPAADPARWLRRVTLDLTGLPPMPGEVAAFESDRSPGARGRVVDRLLASPRFGERWARPWLDLARYADSHGFQRDDLRDLWPYRDWVIAALNADMPFDRFSVLQLAGDLLPEAERGPGMDALVATGFHRAAATNVEAGTDQEEGRVNQVFDRVNTTATVWLGTTLECAQCHNHKYDPFTLKDYYRLFAFFNQSEQETAFTSPKAMAALRFTGPYLDLPLAGRGGRARRVHRAAGVARRAHRRPPARVAHGVRGVAAAGGFRVGAGGDRGRPAGRLRAAQRGPARAPRSPLPRPRPGTGRSAGGAARVGETAAAPRRPHAGDARCRHAASDAGAAPGQFSGPGRGD
jgi:hypothetical protein